MPRRDQVRHPRSPVARWARRLLGMAGTAVVLGVGVAIAAMVVSTDDDEVVTQAPAATPERKPEQKAGRASKPPEPRLSPRQRERLRRAADQVRREGYTPARLADYKPGHVLRVLIGRPVGTTPKGLRAFFFVRDDYIGQDTTTPTLLLRIGRQRTREVTLVYTLFEAGDRECCPKGGKARVRFRWTGDALEPRDEIPPGYQRLPPTLTQ